MDLLRVDELGIDSKAWWTYSREREDHAKHSYKQTAIHSEGERNVRCGKYEVEDRVIACILDRRSGDSSVTVRATRFCRSEGCNGDVYQCRLTW